MTPKTSHLGYIDGLRALAVLLVIFYHAVGEAPWAHDLLVAPPSFDPAWFFVDAASKGSHGVDLFFVISGFCLAYPVLARARRDGSATFDVAGFFTKRLLRIVPPYYAALAVIAIALSVGSRMGAGWTTYFTYDLSPASIVKQALFLDRGTEFVNGSFWTLPVELRWYVAFPLLLWLYARSQRAFYTILAASVLAFAFTLLRAIDIGTLPGFMFGIVAADWYANGNKLARYSGIGFLAALELALLLEPLATRPNAFGAADDTGFFLQTNPGWQLASFFLVVCAGRVAWLRRVFDVRPLQWIGLAAYSLYLVHQPIVTVWNVSGFARSNPLENVAGSVVLAVAAGGVFYLIFERPVLRPAFRMRALDLLRPKIFTILTFIGYPARLALAPVKLRVPTLNAADTPDAGGKTAGV